MSVRLAAAACVLVLSGCATYSSSFNAIERELATQQYNNALKAIEAQSRTNGNACCIC